MPTETDKSPLKAGEPNLPDRIEKIVREWPHWSLAERRRMDEIAEEIINHCIDGGGNSFVREWVKNNIGSNLA